MSVHLSTLHDPAGVCLRESQTISIGDSVLDALIAKYGPSGWNVPTTVYRDRVCPANVINLKDHIEDGLPAQEGVTYIVVHTPLDPGTAGLYLLGAAVFASLALVVLLPSLPVAPVNRRETGSPNNSITGQTNLARPLGRVPDIFGQVIAYPDVIVRSNHEYIDHVKYLTEYLCIGRGVYAIEDVKSGETPINNIDGASYIVSPPGTTYATILDATDSNEVDGQEVAAPDDPALFIESVTADFDSDSTFTSLGGMAAFDILSPGDTFVISEAVVLGRTIQVFLGEPDLTFKSTGRILNSNLSTFSVGDIINVSGAVVPTNDGRYEVSDVGSAHIDCVLVGTATPVVFTENPNPELADIYDGAVSSTVDNTGTYTFSSRNVNTITVQESTFQPAEDMSMTVTSADTASPKVGPFIVPGTPDHVWFDIEAPRGLMDASGGYTVGFNLQIHRLDSGLSPVGSPINTPAVISGNTANARAYTFKVLVPNPGNRYQAAVIRETNRANTPPNNDLTKWTRLAGIEERNGVNFGDVTTVRVKTRATEQAVKQQERKLNIKVTRRLRTYDPVTKTLSTVLSPTKRAADAILELCTSPVMGNRSLTQVDLDTLYGIDSSLTGDAIYGDKLGEFSYTFSDKQTSVASEILVACSACRIRPYRAGGVLKFTRDELRPVRTALFNNRNKLPDTETKTITFQKPDDPDGINLTWMSSETGKPSTILFPEGGNPKNPKTFTAAGIASYEQAWNRGRLEYDRILYQRETVKITTTIDALLVVFGDRVANADGTNVAMQSGEVIGVNGLSYSTSEALDFKGRSSATILLRGATGQLTTPISAMAVPGDTCAFTLVGTPPVPITARNTNGEQIGTLYLFRPEEGYLTSDYTVEEIHPKNDSEVAIVLRNYAPAIFDADTTTPTEI